MSASIQKVCLLELNIPMFEILSPNDQYKFCRKAEKRQYSFQHQVYKLGDSPLEVYYIISGEFKKVGAKGIPFGYLEAGCVFGDEEILESKARKYSVFCSSTEALVYVFKRESFEEHFMANPGIAKKLRDFKKSRNELVRPFHILNELK